MEKVYYTIMYDGKFINSNVFEEDNNRLINAIRFRTYEQAKRHLRLLRSDIDFKIVKVSCELTEM